MRTPGAVAGRSTPMHASVGAVPAVHSRIDLAPVEGWLVFGDGSVWPVRRNVVIGRSPRLLAGESSEADRIVVRDPTVSRRHLVLDLGNEPPTFRDETSRNGSWIVSGCAVRGPLSPSVDADHDIEIVFGESRVRWVDSSWATRPIGGQLHSETGRAIARTFMPMSRPTVEELGER